MSRWKLTLRHGPRVAHREFDDLDEAIDAMREDAIAVVRDGPLETVQGFREYDAADQVAARIALSSGGRLRGRTAGVDVMGDGRLVPFTGAVRRHRLEGRTPEAALAAVRGELDPS